MPLYLFENTDTGELREVFFHMKDDKTYRGESGDEAWKRIYYAPNASIDTDIDPFDRNAYIRKTEMKKSTFGEMWDHNAELSKKRAERTGKDPVKEKYFDQYQKDRNGVVHPASKK